MKTLTLDECHEDTVAIVARFVISFRVLILVSGILCQETTKDDEADRTLDECHEDTVAIVARFVISLRVLILVSGIHKGIRGR